MSNVPFIPESAPFTAEQRAWLNGFFAGIFSRAPGPGGNTLAAAATPVLTHGGLLVALTTRSLHCRESVRFEWQFCRATN